MAKAKIPEYCYEDTNNERCVCCGAIVADYEPEICCKKWTIHTDCDCRGLPINDPICGECDNATSFYANKSKR